LVGIDKATTIRLLRTLTMCGYVRRDGQRRYSLTARLLRLAHRSIEETPLAAVARPFLTALRDQTAETIHLGILEHDRVVYIEKLDSPQTIQLFSRLGSSMPVNTTALGKAICASLSPNLLDELLVIAGLEARTPRSITNLDRLRDELGATAARGYAIDDGENESGVICVGAAIADLHGALAEPAAISISGPDFRMQSRLAELGTQCKQTADRVSRALGLSEADYHGARAQLRVGEEMRSAIGATNLTPAGDAEGRLSM
jgi:IclR family acetate operon transcriptional repressor